jgi:tetratricopeptide (TPR) repeat protein
LISDLDWQIDQLPRRGIKDNAGNPYNPSYYRRGLKKAIDRGGLAVADYVRSYLYKPPSDGYRKLEDADSLDLASEALVADADKSYAHLFTDADRARAQSRLAPHREAIERRKAAMKGRVAIRVAELPQDLGELRNLAAQATAPEEALAVNRAIVSQDSRDTAALNRLGRAYEAIGDVDEAEKMFAKVILVDPGNGVAERRLSALAARRRARSR